MDLIVYQMVQFQVMHVSDGYRAVEELTRSAVAQTNLTVAADRNTFPQSAVCLVLIIIGQLQGILDIQLVGTVKYRCRNIEAQCLGSKA